jgi:hypothetical protein
VRRQVLPEVQKKSRRVVPAGGITWSQPKLGHQALLRQHGQ